MSSQIIDLRAGENLTNRIKVLDLLSNADDFIWITNYYFNERHLSILGEAISSGSNVKEIRLLFRSNKSVDDLISLKTYLKLFQKQYNFKNIQIKIMTDKSIFQTVHDRFFYHKNQAWNFIELDTLLRNQRASITLLPEHDYEKNKKEFESWWNHDKTFDILKDWIVLEKRIEEIEQIVKMDEEKKLKDLLKQHYANHVFYLYKSNQGESIDSKEKKEVELKQALKELENLDIYSEKSFSFIGFMNSATNESIQFVHVDNKMWYVELPLLTKDSKWDGYAYKARSGLVEMKSVLTLFFNNHVVFSDNDIVHWKLSRFQFESDKPLKDSIQKDKDEWKDLV